MKKKQGYSYHYEKAVNEWMEFNIRSADKLGINVDSFEYGYIREAFDECEQVKLVWDFTKGHLLKIKWEHRCWWADDHSTFYYCVMLPIDNVDLKQPSEVFK